MRSSWVQQVIYIFLHTVPYGTVLIPVGCMSTRLPRHWLSPAVTYGVSISYHERGRIGGGPQWRWGTAARGTFGYPYSYETTVRVQNRGHNPE